MESVKDPGFFDPSESANKNRGLGDVVRNPAEHGTNKIDENACFHGNPYFIPYYMEIMGV